METVQATFQLSCTLGWVTACSTVNQGRS